MLGLGPPGELPSFGPPGQSYGFSSSGSVPLAGPQSPAFGSSIGGLRTTAGADAEAELIGLRTTVDASQRSLALLESRLAAKLEQACRRCVDDALASDGPLKELRHSFRQLQSEYSHISGELKRLPAARDVDATIERQTAALEARVGERITAFEHGAARQQQATLERLEGRGGETWRVCLQRMADLEQKAVLQSDLPRVVDRVLAELRKLGPEAFGHGALPGSREFKEMRAAMRKLEAIVAGCEARVIGLSEDVGAKGRIWQANMEAQVCVVAKEQQNIGGRLAGFESSQASHEESVKELVEAAGFRAEEAQRRADEAQGLAKEAVSAATERANATMRQLTSDLDSKMGKSERGLKRELDELRRSLEAEHLDRESLRKDVIEASQARLRSDEEVAALRQVVQTAPRAGPLMAQAREAATQELAKALAEFRHEVKVEVATTAGENEGQLSRQHVALHSLEQRFLLLERRLAEISAGVARAGAVTRSSFTVHHGASGPVATPATAPTEPAVRLASALQGPTGAPPPRVTQEPAAAFAVGTATAADRHVGAAGSPEAPGTHRGVASSPAVAPAGVAPSPTASRPTSRPASVASAASRPASAASRPASAAAVASPATSSAAGGPSYSHAGGNAGAASQAAPPGENSGHAGAAAGEAATAATAVGVVPLGAAAAASGWTDGTAAEAAAAAAPLGLAAAEDAVAVAGEEAPASIVEPPVAVSPARVAAVAGGAAARDEAIGGAVEASAAAAAAAAASAAAVAAQDAAGAGAASAQEVGRAPRGGDSPWDSDEGAAGNGAPQTLQVDSTWDSDGGSAGAAARARGAAAAQGGDDPWGSEESAARRGRQEEPQAAQFAQPHEEDEGVQVPPVLHLSSPSWQCDCSGEYDLVIGEEPQGFPLWKKRGGDRWLYFNTHNMWCVGGLSEQAQGFNCPNGFIFNSSTEEGQLPFEVQGSWTLFDGAGWREDPEVHVSVIGEPARGLAEAAPPEPPRGRVGVAVVEQPQPPARAGRPGAQHDRSAGELSRTELLAGSPGQLGAGAASVEVTALSPQIGSALGEATGIQGSPADFDDVTAEDVDAILQGVRESGGDDPWSDSQEDAGGVPLDLPDSGEPRAAVGIGGVGMGGPAQRRAADDDGSDDWDQSGGSLPLGGGVPAAQAAPQSRQPAQQPARQMEASVDSWDDSGAAISAPAQQAAPAQSPPAAAAPPLSASPPRTQLTQQQASARGAMADLGFSDDEPPPDDDEGSDWD